MLLFGIGTRALPPWGSKTRRNNLLVGLAVRRTAGPSGHANSPHPSSREDILSLLVDLGFPPMDLILRGFHAATVACCPPELCAVNPDAVQNHGQPACQSHDCLFHPASPGDLHGHALSQDHFLNASCSELLRRASSASSHRHSAIFYRSNRSPLIDTWSRLAQTPPRLTWICGTGQAHRQSRDRSAPPQGRHRGSSLVEMMGIALPRVGHAPMTHCRTCATRTVR